MSDCTCNHPTPTERGACSTCGGFACPYAGRGRTRCAPAICDCFVEDYPDSPFALHPEAFAVMVACPAGCGAVGLVGGRTCVGCGWDRGA